MVVKTLQYPAVFITQLFRYQIVYSKTVVVRFYVYVCTGQIPYWHVIRRMRLYFHRKEIYTWDAPNKERFFNAGILRTAAKYALNSEYAPISDMRLIMRQYGICPVQT